MLWALAAAPFFLLLFLLYLWWRKRAVKRIGQPVLVKALFRNHSSLKTVFKFFLILFAFSLGCIAVANPRRPEDTSGEVRKGIDVMIALDVSNSMLATDVAPNRLQLAKSFIRGLIQAMPDNRVGLVLFAGHAYIQVPVTFDHNAAQMFVETAGPASIQAQGTAIGEALEKCRTAFGEQSGKYRSVVLITDGETHDEKAVETAQRLAERGVMVNTVGVGTPGGGTIVGVDSTTKRDATGNVIVSQLNEALLQQIAAVSRGTYLLLNNTPNAVGRMTQQLAGIEKTALGDASLFTYKTFYAWLALPMLFLLILELFFPDRKKSKA